MRGCTLPAGDGERSFQSTTGNRTEQAGSRHPGTCNKGNLSGKQRLRQNRYPGVKPLQQPCTRHGQNSLHSRPAGTSCPYAQPTCETPYIPVDHTGQHARIQQFAARRQRSAQQLLANKHTAMIEQHRSETRPRDPRREVHGVIRREIERVRAAKGIQAPCNLRGS